MQDTEAQRPAPRLRLESLRLAVERALFRNWNSAAAESRTSLSTGWVWWDFEFACVGAVMTTRRAAIEAASSTASALEASDSRPLSWSIKTFEAALETAVSFSLGTAALAQGAAGLTATVGRMGREAIF